MIFITKKKWRKRRVKHNKFKIKKNKNLDANDQENIQTHIKERKLTSSQSQGNLPTFRQQLPAKDQNPNKNRHNRKTSSMSIRVVDTNSKTPRINCRKIKDKENEILNKSCNNFLSSKQMVQPTETKVFLKLRPSDFHISSNKSSFIKNDLEFKFDNKASFLNDIKDSKDIKDLKEAPSSAMGYKCDISPIQFKKNKLDEKEIIQEKTELHGNNSTDLRSKNNSPDNKKKDKGKYYNFKRNRWNRW